MKSGRGSCRQKIYKSVELRTTDLHRMVEKIFRSALGQQIHTVIDVDYSAFKKFRKKHIRQRFKATVFFQSFQ